MDEFKEMVVECARELWAECPEDFCIQHDAGEIIVFGGSNRVIWSVWNGFCIDEPYCSEKFIAHYKKFRDVR